ncbi:MAG: hypothetical protein LBK98_04150 [Peptococcaceae bacterium]|jgi:hypothetical protein|nr:hypothetical protein [Peptococcaceae bacterium]
MLWKKLKKGLALSLAWLLLLAVAAPAPALASGVYYVDEEDIGGGDGSDPGAVNPAAAGRYYVNIDLWHASLDQASMGNVAFYHTALVITGGGRSVIQIGTHPAEVSGYTSALVDVESARAVSTAPFTTNTKHDGQAHDITYLRVFELDLPNVPAPTCRCESMCPIPLWML